MKIGPGFLALCLSTSLFLTTLGRGHAQNSSGPDALLAKRDSLEREIRQKILTDKDKAQLKHCGRVKRQFLVEKRNTNPLVAQVDSALKEAKLHGMQPGHPEANRLMERKYSLEKGFEEAWLATSEGKTCDQGDNERRKRGDAAVAVDPHYKKVAEKLRQQGLL